MSNVQGQSNPFPSLHHLENIFKDSYRQEIFLFVYQRRCITADRHEGNTQNWKGITVGRFIEVLASTVICLLFVKRVISDQLYDLVMSIVTYTLSRLRASSKFHRDQTVFWPPLAAVIVSMY